MKRCTCNDNKKSIFSIDKNTIIYFVFIFKSKQTNNASINGKDFQQKNENKNK